MAAAVSRVYDHFDDFLSKQIPEDFQWPEAEQRALLAAEKAFRQGTGDPYKALELRMKAAIKAEAAKLTSEGEAKWAEKYRKESAEAIRVEKEAAAAAARAGESPTGARGTGVGPGAQYTTQEGAALARMRGLISAEQYKRDRATLPFA